MLSMLNSLTRSDKIPALDDETSFPRSREPMLSKHHQFSMLSMGSRLRGNDGAAASWS